MGSGMQHALYMIKMSTGAVLRRRSPCSLCAAFTNPGPLLISVLMPEWSGQHLAVAESGEAEWTVFASSGGSSRGF